jgi:ABC-type antimicrobial peptide transport system permease subunit
MVVRMVVRQSSILVATGIAIGAGVSLAAGRTVESMIFGLAPSDPRTLALTGLSLAAVTLAASYLPARRAARMDPMTALRDQ